MDSRRQDALGNCFNSMQQSQGTGAMFGQDDENGGFGIFANAIKNKSFQSTGVNGSKLIGINEDRFKESLSDEYWVKGSMSILVGCFEGNKMGDDADGDNNHKYLKAVYVKEEIGEITKILDGMKDNDGTNRSGESNKTTDGDKFRWLLAVKKDGKDFAKDVGESDKSGATGSDGACSWSSWMKEGFSAEKTLNKLGYKKSGNDEKCYLGIGDFSSSG